MSNDAALTMFLSFLFGIIFIVYATNNMTNDHKIYGNKKIQIGNAVYRCEKVQELDLK